MFLSSHAEPESLNKTIGITKYGYVVKNTGEVVLLASLKMAIKFHAAHLQEKEINEKLQLRFSKLLCREDSGN